MSNIGRIPLITSQVSSSHVYDISIRSDLTPSPQSTTMNTSLPLSDAFSYGTIKAILDEGICSSCTKSQVKRICSQPDYLFKNPEQRSLWIASLLGCVALLFVCALLAGLTLAVFQLDPVRLAIISQTGSSAERLAHGALRSFKTLTDTCY